MPTRLFKTDETDKGQTSDSDEDIYYNVKGPSPTEEYSRGLSSTVSRTTSPESICAVRAKEGHFGFVYSVRLDPPTPVNMDLKILKAQAKVISSTWSD